MVSHAARRQDSFSDFVRTMSLSKIALSCSSSNLTYGSLCLCKERRRLHGEKQVW